MKSSVNLFNDTERNSWYNTNEFKQTRFKKDDFESFTQTYMNSIKSDSVNIPVKNYSATTVLDNIFGYSINKDYPTPLARIEAVTKSRPVENVVAEMNKGEKKYQPAEFAKDGRINREFAFVKKEAEPVVKVQRKAVPESKPVLTEQQKMAKINANYEHDKKMLAKKDPMFAKNKFWDVGHAEGEGEMTEREMRKMAEKEAIKEIENIKENRE